MEFALKIGSIIDGATSFNNGAAVIGKKFNAETVITSRGGLEVDGKTFEVKNDLTEYTGKEFELYCITEQKIIATGIIGTDPVRKSLIEKEPVNVQAK